jgi:hypothetical protein
MPIKNSVFWDIKPSSYLTGDTLRLRYRDQPRYQNPGKNRDINIGNRSFENVSQFKYLGTTVTDQKLIQEEIKRRLNSGNASYHSVQNFCPHACCHKI